ncbi:hypothetical protein NP493_487g01004 [Ridgeia piscesae]|uniref:Uncharacterized protein n=1 Tax=Ridgeia piscesae TaxID=27915 RepID=A0AAD9KXP2_RIDPI|nr:hypothetical protein NP493_487g01004 [Ridgeia piscesae]
MESDNDANDTSPNQGPDQNVSGAQTETQGVQLMSLMMKYFKTAGFLLSVWTLGYFRFSSSWILLALFFYIGNEEFRKGKDAKRSFSRDAASRTEQRAILARVDELPAWVYFPDVERAEWLNKMLRQMWPFIGEYFRDMLMTSVLPSVEASLPKMLLPFKFNETDLGDIPPRIGGMKVYIENVKRNEIYMDMELFYASDCNIKMTVRGVQMGIKDLMLHGTMRVVMKPLVNKLPIIGGYTVFFLNQPEIDFDLTGVSNILDFPGLSKTLRTVIQDQIAQYMVLPNRMCFPMLDEVSAALLLHPMPQVGGKGVIRVNIVAGRDLKYADVKLLGGRGKSDPYCKLLVGAQKFKTKVIQNSVAPHWDDLLQAVVDQKLGQYIEIEVMDEDPGEDDALGNTSIDIEEIAKQGSIDSWFPLDNVNTGLIHVKARWFHLSKNPDDLERTLYLCVTQSLSETVEEHLANALLFVTVDSATALKRLKKMVEPSAYALVSVGNKEQKTATKPKTTNPTWEEHLQFLIHNPTVQDLEVNVVDSGKGSMKLGSVTVHLKDLLRAKDMTVNRPFQLRGADPQSKIQMQLCLRILTSFKPENWSQDTVFPQQPPAAPKEEEEDDEEEEEIKGGAGTTPPTKPKHKAGSRDPSSERSSPPASDKKKDNDVGTESTGQQHDRSRSSTATPERPAGQELRQRTVGKQGQVSESEPDLGRIQVTVRYSAQRSRLVAVVHKCVGLLACDSDDMSDPYVRLYLLPDRSSSTKKKTQIVRNNLSPVFDETFEWPVSAAEATTRTIEIGVKNAVGVFSKSRTHIGQVYIDLSSLDLSKATTEW